MTPEDFIVLASLAVALPVFVLIVLSLAGWALGRLRVVHDRLERPQ